jgi:ABC-2 type transport system permease protein
MLRDLSTVFRKEWIEILDQFSRFKRGGWSVLLVFLFLGVFVPLQIGAEWAVTPVMYFYWPFMTASMTSTIVADSVAGERERHTLETLLATRLPDEAILLGKVLAAVSYGYAFALTNVAIGLLTVTVVHGDQAASMPWPRFLLLLSLIGGSACMVAGIGLLVSLRTATVRQAQQLFGVFFLAATMLPLLGWTAIGAERQAAILAWATSAGVDALGFRASFIVGGIGLCLTGYGILQFRRGVRVLED